jgi:pantothenate kinase
MAIVAPEDLATWIVERAGSADRYVFGVAGPPGSGKSTLASRLGDELSAPVVPMDGFHRSNVELAALGLSEVKGAPETFDAGAFVELVRRLRRPRSEVTCPTFDRTIDEPLADQVRVTPADVVVIVEGNYLLLDEAPWAGLAGLFDAVAFLDVPDDVRIERLVERHVAFGRERSDAVDFVRDSDEANTRRIAAGRARADVLVSSVPPGENAQGTQR